MLAIAQDHLRPAVHEWAQKNPQLSAMNGIVRIGVDHGLDSVRDRLHGSEP
jgi:hypothetical protein